MIEKILIKNPRLLLASINEIRKYKKIKSRVRNKGKIGNCKLKIGNRNAGE